MATLKKSITPLTLMYSRAAFHAKIFQWLEANRASSGHKASYGRSITALHNSAAPGTSLLKTALTLRAAALSSSYMTFPEAGTMRNGSVYARPISVTRISVKDYSLLPTPLKSDGDKSGMFRSSKALLKYLEHHTDRLFYQCQLNGLTRTQITQVYTAIMGFPEGWTDLPSAQLAMQFV